MKSGPRRWSVLAAAAFAALLLSRGAGAAPAGDTPPHLGPRPYDAPRVDVLRTPVPGVPYSYVSREEAGVSLRFDPTVGVRAHALLARALAVRAELSAQLRRDVLGTVEIRVAATPAEVAGLSPAGLAVPAGGVSSWAFGGARLVVMSLGAPGALEVTDLDERLRHELAHVALDDVALVDAAHENEIPRWFHEGYALHVSGEDAAQRAEALTLASLRDQLVSLAEVDARFPDGPAGASLAGAEAADFVRYLIERPGRDAFPAFVEGLHRGEPFEDAMTHAYGEGLAGVERSWRRDVAKRYGFVPVFAGATLLWMVVALGVILQNRRLAARRVRVSELPLPAAERLVAREPDHPHLPIEDDDLAQAIPPDPEVPKIEHGGRWYTLH